MKYSDFEKQIGDKLRNEEIQFDTAAFYQSLSSKKKKRRGAIIIALPILMGLGLLYLIGINYSATQDTIETISGLNSQANTTIQSSNSALKADQISNINDQTLAQNTTKSNDNLALQNSRESKLGTNSDYSVSVKSNLSNSASTSNTETINTNIINERKKISEKYKNNISLQSINAQPSSSNQSNSKSLNTATTKSVENPQEKIHLDISNLSGPITNTTIRMFDKVSSINLINPLLLDQNKINISTKIDCPDFRINKKLFDIEVLAEAGYFRPLKQYIQIDPNSSEVDALRQQNESSREGYHAAIYLKMIGRNLPLYLQTGVSQDYLTERMTVEYSYIQRDTTRGIISITESENGDTITTIIGDIIQEKEISGFKKRHYRIQTIDIPIMAGYQFSLGRFDLGLEAGAVLNISMRSMGNILTSPTDFEDIDMKSPFKSKVGVSYIGGLSLGYYVGPRSKIYLNTKMRLIPEAVNSSENTLQQKYNFLGLNIGYGYTF